jgi:hypothetical protein
MTGVLKGAARSDYLNRGGGPPRPANSDANIIAPLRIPVMNPAIPSFCCATGGIGIGVTVGAKV